MCLFLPADSQQAQDLYCRGLQETFAMGKRGGQRARRVQLIQGKEYKLPKLCSTFRGYNLHCGVVVSARNRKSLEGLCRYILRPPLAKDRLRKVGGNDYELKLKTLH
jgi:hypothetical protein